MASFLPGAAPAAPAPAAGAAAPAAAAGPIFGDLSGMYDKPKCFCLNQDDEFPLANLFNEDERFVLRSDCDEQLLIHIEFNQRVKLHSIQFRAPADADSGEHDDAPSTVKVFVDQPSMAFNSVEDTPPKQVLALTEKDYAAGAQTLLKFVNFQSVGSVTLFVEENLGGEEQTRLAGLKFFGVPINAFDVAAIKKC